MGKIAVYLRLSVEDSDNRDESNSISSQRNLIFRYISGNKELAVKEVSEFCDDGCTGSNMERPGMQRMMEEVKSGGIDSIIVKDMSRFSRDYIELGTYMNHIFPFLKIRFIAINDHYDSREHRGSTAPIDTSFQTLLYDLYSKDVSVKTKAALGSKYLNGEYAFGAVPFGYMKSKERKNTIIIREKEAEIIRYIFSLAYNGNTSAQIARKLNEEKVPARMQMRFPERKAEGRVKGWSREAVRDILNNRFYLGEMAYGKSKRIQAGDKSGIKVPKEERGVIKDHHEPLVTPEIYEKVCRFQRKAPAKAEVEKSPLRGKLFCGGCGYAMAYKPIRGKNKYRRYECWKHAALQIPDCCTYFSADLLEETVLSMLNKKIMLYGDEAKQKRNLIAFQESCIRRFEGGLAKCREQKKQLQMEREELYEAYALRHIDADQYREKMDFLKEKILSLEVKEGDLKEELGIIVAEYENPGDDMKQIIRCSHLEVLTQDVVDIFVKKIYVYKGKRIEIAWNFKDSIKTVTWH